MLKRTKRRNFDNSPTVLLIFSRIVSMWLFQESIPDYHTWSESVSKQCLIHIWQTFLFPFRVFVWGLWFCFAFCFLFLGEFLFNILAYTSLRPDCVMLFWVYLCFHLGIVYFSLGSLFPSPDWLGLSFSVLAMRVSVRG